ncbi:helix-turn-helix transcriptional regulator, partial [Parapedobacter tibetensis]|uniref:helix-turn-helix transcriptional regulator n=1 Tax=Parapedobacter tibetensis TaxID=2972951 RepID=UPI00214D1670
TPASRYTVTPEGINAGLWMSCKEAWDLLGIARSTLEERLNAGKLTRYHKKGDGHLAKPRVWLMRSEVDAYYRDYTLMKGKEKK